MTKRKIAVLSFALVCLACLSHWCWGGAGREDQGGGGSLPHSVAFSQDDGPLSEPTPITLAGDAEDGPVDYGSWLCVDERGEPVRDFQLLELDRGASTYRVIAKSSTESPISSDEAVRRLGLSQSDRLVGVCSPSHVGVKLERSVFLRLLESGPLVLKRCGHVSVVIKGAGSRLGNVVVLATGDWSLASSELPPLCERFFDFLGQVVRIPRPDVLRFTVNASGVSDALLVPPYVEYTASPFSPGVLPSLPVSCAPGEERELVQYIGSERVVVGRIVDIPESWGKDSIVRIYSLEPKGGLTLRRELGQSRLGPDGSFSAHLSVFDGAIQVVLTKDGREQHVSELTVKGRGVWQVGPSLNLPNTVPLILSVVGTSLETVSEARITVVGDGGAFVEKVSSGESGDATLEIPQLGGLFSVTIEKAGFLSTRVANLSFDELCNLRQLVLTQEPQNIARRVTLVFPSLPSSHLGWDIFLRVGDANVLSSKIAHEVEKTLSLPLDGRSLRVVDRGNSMISRWYMLDELSFDTAGLARLEVEPEVGGRLDFSVEGNYTVFDGNGASVASFVLRRSESSVVSVFVPSNEEHRVEYKSATSSWSRDIAVAQGEVVQVVR